MSNEVRKIQNAHHACICDDIKERVLGQRLPRPQFEDVDLKCAVGKLLCRSCGSDLGNVSIYKKCPVPDPEDRRALDGGQYGKTRRKEEVEERAVLGEGDNC